MKYHILSFVKDFFAIILNYLFVVALWLMFLAAASATLYPLWIAGMFLMPALFYVFRLKINNVGLFTLFHVIISVATVYFFKGDIKDTIIFAAIVLFITVRSFVIRFNGSEPGENAFHPAMVGVVFLIAAAVCDYMKAETIGSALPKLSLIYMAVFLLYLYVKKFIWFDFMNRKVITHMPTGNLLKAGAPYVAGLSGLYALVTALCVNESLVRKLSSWLKEHILMFLKWLGSLLPKASEESNEVSVTSEVMPEQYDLSELVEESEPSKILEVLQDIFLYITVAAMIIGIVALIYYIIHEFIKRFHGVDRSGKIELTEDYVEEREEVLKKTGEKTERRHFIKTPSEKIRNMYYRLVLDNKELCPSPDKITAREFAGLFKETARESALNFAGLYEKARYSAESVTGEDVKAAKAFASEIERNK